VSKYCVPAIDAFDYASHFYPPGNGMLVGGRCEFTCDKRLNHVFCNPISSKCECEKNYPVKIGELSVSH
jgi:hypothetical protein